MDIVLYYAPVACSLVPYVTLTEAGADFISIGALTHSVVAADISLEIT